MPWSEGKHRLTEVYVWFLAGWTKRLNWKGVAESFRISWDHVFCSAKMAVTWGREIKTIGIGEIQWQRGHKYLTLVHQIDANCKRLLWIGKKSERSKPYWGSFAGMARNGPGS